MSNPLSPRATGTDVCARVAADDENVHDVLHAIPCAVQRSETTQHESCSVVASATHMNTLPPQPLSTHRRDSGQGGSWPADGRPPQRPDLYHILGGARNDCLTLDITLSKFEESA